jgi:ADP-ribose pyrophosphatase
MSLQAWETLSRRVVLDQSPNLIVENHRIQLPGGEIIENWPWLVTRDYVIVVPQLENGDYLIFRQTKYAVSGTSLAPVGGYLEAGENPLEAAQRELLEETGCKADKWTQLGSFAVNGNYGDGTAHLFLAEGASQQAQPNADDLEDQELLHLEQAELRAGLASGQFKVLAWTTAVALTLLFKEREADAGGPETT